MEHLWCSVMTKRWLFPFASLISTSNFLGLLQIRSLIHRVTASVKEQSFENRSFPLGVGTWRKHLNSDWNKFFFQGRTNCSLLVTDTDSAFFYEQKTKDRREQFAEFCKTSNVCCSCKRRCSGEHFSCPLGPTKKLFQFKLRCFRQVPAPVWNSCSQNFAPLHSPLLCEFKERICKSPQKIGRRNERSKREKPPFLSWPNTRKASCGAPWASRRIYGLRSMGCLA